MKVSLKIRVPISHTIGLEKSSIFGGRHRNLLPQPQFIDLATKTLLLRK